MIVRRLDTPNTGASDLELLQYTIDHIEWFEETFLSQQEEQDKNWEFEELLTFI